MSEKVPKNEGEEKSNASHYIETNSQTQEIDPYKNLRKKSVETLTTNMKKKKLEPRAKTMDKYYEWIEELNQKFECTLIWSKHNAVKESWWSGNEMSEDLDDEKNDYDQGWRNNNLIRKLNEYRSRVPHCGPLTSPFSDPTEKRFCLEEYNEELKKQEIVLDFLIEAENSDQEGQRNPNQTDIKGEEHVNSELTKEEENEL
ncbi:6080_t:CDS:2 [Gigaspora margarita]|uniref:6080_t:CDS:1 n=1 Tax=Gigaspora margarita TaxID=4874 RepID=A0ABM8VXI4_GIGMA|nr:6080_t:CDS:2 [Gigaspora margarita]